MRKILEQNVFPQIPRENFMAIVWDFGRAKAQFQSFVSSFLRSFCYCNNQYGIIRIDLVAFSSLGQPIALRVLAKIISVISGDFHPVFVPQLGSIATFLRDNTSKGQQRCLGGCFFVVDQKSPTALVFKQFLRGRDISTVEEISLGQTIKWNGRFDISFYSAKSNDSCAYKKAIIKPVEQRELTTVFLLDPTLRSYVKWLPPLAKASLPMVIAPDGRLLAIPPMGQFLHPDYEISCTWNPRYSLHSGQ